MSKQKNILKSQKNFDKLPERKKANYICDYYNKKKGQDIYATSPDQNLRELEIDFIINHIKGPRILDLGCGNGYTLLRLAEKIKGELIGVDFSPKMIQGANLLSKKFKNKLKSFPKFYEGDATEFFPPGRGKINTIITERFLLNLPTQKIQYKVIKNIYNLLAPRGLYLMIEGSQDGLRKLNTLRKFTGLDPILDRGKVNLFSRKFNDAYLEKFLKRYFEIVQIETFDLYYLISRIAYPKIIYPKKPQYNHPINKIAKELNNKIDFPSRGIGHVKGYLLRKKSKYCTKSFIG